MTRMLARHLPNSELVIVPEAGQFPLLGAAGHIQHYGARFHQPPPDLSVGPVPPLILLCADEVIE
jgi:hypothetical protein